MELWGLACARCRRRVEQCHPQRRRRRRGRSPGRDRLARPVPRQDEPRLPRRSRFAANLKELQSSGDPTSGERAVSPARSYYSRRSPAHPVLAVQTVAALIDRSVQGQRRGAQARRGRCSRAQGPWMAQFARRKPSVGYRSVPAPTFCRPFRASGGPFSKRRRVQLLAIALSDGGELAPRASRAGPCPTCRLSLPECTRDVHLRRPAAQGAADVARRPAPETERTR